MTLDLVGCILWIFLKFEGFSSSSLLLASDFNNDLLSFFLKHYGLLDLVGYKILWSNVFWIFLKLAVLNFFLFAVNQQST